MTPTNNRDRFTEVICDSILSAEYDRVMPIFDDESSYVAVRVGVAGHRSVLDIGTGSGILAVAAARQSSSVIGVDINPRAVKYARESATSNGVEGKCSFVVGDLYEPIQERVFNCVVVNPPFVPLPFGYRMFLSADGGPDGLAVVRRVLEGLDAHLTQDGRFLLLTMALGDEHEPLVFRHLKPLFQKRKARMRTTHIYEKKCIEAEPFLELFESVPTYSEWRRFLEKQRLTHLYYMLHEVEPNGRFEHVEVQNTVPLAQTEFSGSWAARLNRFRRWFEAKAKNSGDGLGDSGGADEKPRSAGPRKLQRATAQLAASLV